jgi:hypothetical protein
MMVAWLAVMPSADTNPIAIAAALDLVVLLITSPKNIANSFPSAEVGAAAE